MARRGGTSSQSRLSILTGQFAAWQSLADRLRVTLTMASISKSCACALMAHPTRARCSTRRYVAPPRRWVTGPIASSRTRWRARRADHSARQDGNSTGGAEEEGGTDLLELDMTVTPRTKSFAGARPRTPSGNCPRRYSALPFVGCTSGTMSEDSRSRRPHPATKARRGRLPIRIDWRLVHNAGSDSRRVEIPQGEGEPRAPVGKLYASTLTVATGAFRTILGSSIRASEREFCMTDRPRVSAQSSAGTA